VSTPDLDPAAGAALLRRAARLQAEAVEVIRDLDLLTLLGRVGHAEQVGSSVSELMVWREIDIGVRCREPTTGRAWAALRPLLVQSRVIRLEYRDESGGRSPSGKPSDQRDVFVAFYETVAGDEWKLDLSLWLSDAPRTQLAQINDLRQRNLLAR
jgi:hypothetical protein